MIRQQRIREFQKKVFNFYESNKRELPWRATVNPYCILISEVMLQQTQAERVIPRYKKWVERWPRVESLARAQKRDVLREWMGLGYNNRALNLRRTAEIIAQEFGGDVLAAVRTRKLPGVGLYTARAVKIFSANEDITAVDTNIRRILMHEFSDTPESAIQSLAEACLPKGRSREWHNALMDYGALKLTAKATGIRPRTKQSRFEGSDRQVRAGIVRFLLARRAASLEKLQKQQKIEQERLKKILNNMVRDGLIRKGRKYSLVD